MSFFGGNSSRPVIGGNKPDHPQSLETNVPAGASESSPPHADMEALRPAIPSNTVPDPKYGPTPADHCTNVVGAGDSWEGTLSVDESVRIDGIFSGEVHAKGTVQISQGADVNAKVTASYVVISGAFRGEIRCDRTVELMASGRVRGEVITKALSVREGAALDARVQMTSGSPSSSEGHSQRGPERITVKNGSD